jgi:hypothetical protein
MEIQRFDPIFIGPVGVGKTTVSALVAQALGVAHVEYDNLRRGYFEELGFDMEQNLRLNAAEGWHTMYRYWKVFSPYAIERLRLLRAERSEEGSGATGRQ